MVTNDVDVLDNSALKVKIVLVVVAPVATVDHCGNDPVLLSNCPEPPIDKLCKTIDEEDHVKTPLKISPEDIIGSTYLDATGRFIRSQ